MDSTAPKNVQYRPFGIALRDLLLEANITTRLGNPAWVEFASKLHGVSYETLRKAVSGERPASQKVMEISAAALGVAPEVFAEYRLRRTRDRLDPAQVGIESAVAALRRLEEAPSGNPQQDPPASGRQVQDIRESV